MDLELRFEIHRPDPMEVVACVPNSMGVIGWSRFILEIILLLVTVSGNLLVILSILIVKVLRQPRNYLVLSLSVADLLVGLYVLPFKLALTQNCDQWDFGKTACYFWIVGDVTCCTASILGLTVIALDRYVAITYPLFYKVNSTSNKAYIAITASWILSIIATIPYWMFGNFYHDSYVSPNIKNLKVSTCILESRENWHHIFSILVSFFLPLGIMTYVYANIWRVLVIHTKNKEKIVPNVEPVDLRLDLKYPPYSKILCNLSGRIFETFQERKGCITMGIVMGVFITCWLPYFSLFLVDTVASMFELKMHVSHHVYSVFIWLGYANSCANPFIYTMFNQEFRYAFKELICLRACTLNTRIRAEMYSQQVGNSNGANNSTFSSITDTNTMPSVDRQRLDSVYQNI